MTRFAATTAEERQELVVDAIAAHRERSSAFCTMQAAPVDTDTPPPWIQYAEGLLNLDCTETELDELKSVLESYPAATVAELSRPEDAEGTNVRVEARTDDERVADLIDTVFQEVYDREPDYRLWVTEL
jgi:hypothetical protein